MDGSNWFVITGGPGTGKTTLLNELAKRGYTTMPEVARLVIDEALASGQPIESIRSDEQGLQQSIVERRFALQSALPEDHIIIFDRGMHDSLAYLQYYDFPISQQLLEACQYIHYNTVFLLDQLPSYAQDYGRTEDEVFAKAIQEKHEQVYKDYDMAPVIVPAVSVHERANIIVSYLDKSTPV